MSHPHDSGRRDFLRWLCRGAIAAGLLGGIGTLAARNREMCVNNGYCRECGALRECGLPQALSAKQAGVGVNNARTR